jgi:hypothetical protein
MKTTVNVCCSRCAHISRFSIENFRAPAPTVACPNCHAFIPFDERHILVNAPPDRLTSAKHEQIEEERRKDGTETLIALMDCAIGGAAAIAVAIFIAVVLYFLNQWSSYDQIRL